MALASDTQLMPFTAPRRSHFEEGSLQVVVIPGPGVALPGGLGMLALIRRKRVG